MSEAADPLSVDPLSERITITREGLADGSLLARIRARLLPGMVVKTDEEIAASLEHTLSSHDPSQDLWLFGYGSLMWNPAFAYAESHVALLRGWHRRFCLWLEMGRGSPENPGLMLGLDRGGVCRGVAFRIPAHDVRPELLLVWRREMFGTAYDARWVTVRMNDLSVRAITFVVNRSHPRYAGRISDEIAAARIAAASGALGTCASYLHNTLDHLATLGIRDPGLLRIAAAVSRD
jgi:glutathione-specific gamma-glutamylcyclotransferase